ncbi:MAG: FHA domain-containing protein [Pseudomonadota bacterium]
MSLLAAHINDGAITVLNAERLLYRQPGFALLDDEGISLGDAAEHVARLKPRRIDHRFWERMDTEPLGYSRFPNLSSADLVSRHLEQVWSAVSGAGDQLLIAVPGYMSNQQLSLFLGIASELNIPIAGLVDAAVAATRREYRNAVPVHIDISLHKSILSRLSQDGQVLVERTEVIDASGLSGLSDAWIRKISDCFVHQSRFDPLHTAETEQALADALPHWLAASMRADSVSMTVESRGTNYTAEIESIDLVSAAAPVYQRIAAQLRTLLRADEVPAVQLSDRAARMPGLADMLSARVGGEVFLLEPGATARGLLKRGALEQTGGAAVSLLKALPWDQAAVDIDVDIASNDGTQPTHVLFDHVAYPVNDRPLVLGSQSSDGARWIDFGRDMPGVSRRHCSLVREGGQCVVEDHSRYGTFLNGHRIDGSVVLQNGDTLRLGTPGFELELIRAVT